MMKFKNIEDFKTKVENDETLRSEFIANPSEFLSKVSTKTSLIDKGIFKWVIALVGAVLIFAVITSTVYIFQFKGEEVPTFLVTIGSTSLGALVGLLTPTAGR